MFRQSTAQPVFEGLLTAGVVLKESVRAPALMLRPPEEPLKTILRITIAAYFRTSKLKAKDRGRAGLDFAVKLLNDEIRLAKTLPIHGDPHHTERLANLKEAWEILEGWAPLFLTSLQDAG